MTQAEFPTEGVELTHLLVVSDIAGKLSRIDPATNMVAAEIAVAAGSVAPVFGDGMVWISSPEKSVVTRVDLQGTIGLPRSTEDSAPTISSGP